MARARLHKSSSALASTTSSAGRPAEHLTSSTSNASSGGQLSLRKLGIKLVVCDMAGTTVEEHGLVYKVLRESMVKHGLTVSEADMHPHHGAAKGEVIRSFIEKSGCQDVTAAMIDSSFESSIKDACKNTCDLQFCFILSIIEDS